MATPMEQSPEGTVPQETAQVRLWRTVALFLPAPLREANKEGRLRTLVYLVLAVTVGPLLVTFLAAFWLSAINRYIGLDFIQSLRTSYVRSIQEGFSLDELVARKLDYVQFISLHLQPGAQPANFPVYLEPRQRAQVTLTDVYDTPLTGEAACRYESVGRRANLVVVKLGNVVIRECPMTAQGDCTQTLDQTWWNRHGPELGGGMPQLTIERAQGVANLCAEIEVEGRVTVFKNVYQ